MMAIYLIGLDMTILSTVNAILSFIVLHHPLEYSVELGADTDFYFFIGDTHTVRLFSHSV